MSEFTTNRHHVIHNRQEWSLRKPGLWLREQPSLIKRIDVDTHRDIHDECPPIPLLGHLALMRVAHLYIPGRNVSESIDNLSFAIEEAGEHKKAKPFERKLGNLAIEALQMQKPFLNDYPVLRVAA